jgi:hypothetical protein
MAHFLRQSRKKPGYPFQSFLPLCGKKGFPLLSLARAPAGFSHFAQQHALKKKFTAKSKKLKKKRDFHA